MSTPPTHTFTFWGARYRDRRTMSVCLSLFLTVHSRISKLHVQTSPNFLCGLPPHISGHPWSNYRILYGHYAANSHTYYY